MENENSVSHAWASYGMAWETETVSKQAGPNKTDRVAFRTLAQLPRISDFELFETHFGKPAVLAMLNASNSIRVRAQAINRARLEAGDKETEKLRNSVYNAMRGVRASASPIQVRVYTLPNGELYNGSDVVEFRQLYAVALVDAGVAAAVATMLAGMQNLA